MGGGAMGQRRRLERALARSAEAPPRPHPATTVVRKRVRMPLEELAYLARARDGLLVRERTAVARARDDGASWQHIADAIGLPETTVHRRYRA